MKRDNTVTQLAKILQRSRPAVVSLIQSGRLLAYDAAPEGRYRQWRVTPEALDDFRNRHRAVAPKPPRGKVMKPRRQFV